MDQGGGNGVGFFEIKKNRHNLLFIYLFLSTLYFSLFSLYLCYPRIFLIFLVYTEFSYFILVRCCIIYCHWQGHGHLTLDKHFVDFPRPVLNIFFFPTRSGRWEETPINIMLLYCQLYATSRLQSESYLEFYPSTRVIIIFNFKIFKVARFLSLSYLYMKILSK